MSGRPAADITRPEIARPEITRTEIARPEIARHAPSNAPKGATTAKSGTWVKLADA